MSTLNGFKAFLFSAALLTVSTGWAFAGSLESEVVGFSGAAHRLVLSDRSIMEYDPATTLVPAPITIGDRVEIEFTSSEDEGFRAVQSIMVIKAAQ